MRSAQRERLLGGLDVSKLVGVEIGALDRPYVGRQDGDVIYVDYADRETLVERYKTDPKVNVDNIVHVDAIWGDNTLTDAVNHRKVDYVVAAHVIEHVPDLITWLGELHGILKDTGEVRLIVPDKRFTFDYLREETRFADVLNSYLVRARIPQTHSALDFLLNAAKVDCAAAWDGRIESEKLQKFHKFEGALGVARDILANHTYHDVHCWAFTPQSFARLMGKMAQEGLIDFACERFHDTEKYTLEFFVSLRPSTDRDHIVESWRHMAHEAREHLDGLDIDLTQFQIKPHQLVAEINALRVALTSAQRSIADIENSTSWRITKPLRSAATLIRRLTK